ncbi:MAG: outer membrane protein transport protein [candidate division Zixibacteria bacterium]|nr:outer membrane protein transport protein [candidate division Zixibacteria bacterium]
MKLKLTLTIALLFLVFVNLGYPQVLVTRNIMDYNFLGGGARARAMGGAFFAVSDDPSAASWNPAGLVQLDKYQMGATLYFINPKMDYTTSYTTSSFPNSLKQSKSTISFGSVVIPFKLFNRDLVGSVLYNRASDIYDKRVYNYLGVYTFYEDSWRIWDKTEEVKGGLDVLVLSLGGKAYKDLSFGLGLNIYTGSYEYNSDQLIELSWNTAFDTSFVYRPLIKGSYSGVNFTLGTMYKYQDLRVGAVVKTPFKLKEKDDVQYFIDFIVNGVVNPYSIQSGVIWPVEYSQKWEIPLMIGFGVSYQIKGLTLAGDVELRDFSSSKLIYPKKWVDPNSPDTSMTLDWNSLTQFRVGAEYLLQSKYGTIPLRVGYRSDPKVFSDLKDVEIDFPDYITGKQEMTIINQANGEKVSGSTFSLGTGIGWKQIKLDFTYELSQYKTKMSGENLGVPFDIKDIEKKDNRFLVNFTGFF